MFLTFLGFLEYCYLQQCGLHHKNDFLDHVPFRWNSTATSTYNISIKIFISIKSNTTAKIVVLSLA